MFYLAMVSRNSFETRLYRFSVNHQTFKYGLCILIDDFTHKCHSQVANLSLTHQIIQEIDNWHMSNVI